MNHLINIITCIAVFILMGCAEDSSENSTNTLFDNTSLIDLNVVKTGEFELLPSHDSIIIPFEIIKSNSYIITLDYDKSIDYLYPRWVDKEGNTLSDGRELQALFSGEVFIKMSASYFDTPIKVSYKIEILPPLDTSIEGLWIQSEVRVKAWDVEQVLTYSPKNAQRLLSIRNDSAVYYYPAYNSTVTNPGITVMETSETGEITYNEETTTSYGELFIEFWCEDDDFETSLSDNQITLQSSSERGSETYIYTRYDGTLDDIVWEEQSFELDPQLEGVWYLSKRVGREYHYIDFSYNDIVKEYEEEIDTLYYSLQESNSVIQITEDSLIVYTRTFGGFSRSGYDLKNQLYTIRSMQYNNGSLHDKNVIFFQEYNEEVAAYFFDEYSRLDHDTLPLEWYQLPKPDSINDLELGVSESLYLEENDTLWYSIYLNEENRYDLNLDQLTNEVIDPEISHTLSFSLFNSDRTLNQLIHGLDFSVEKSGEYYIIIKTGRFDYDIAMTVDIF